jgi:mRNA interferase HigB
MRRLREFWENHASAKKPLQAWYVHAKQAQWQNLAEVKQDFPSADQVQRFTIFNIGGNNYRLIVRIEYAQQKVYIRSIVTHAEYDKGRWKDDPWYS